MPFSLTKDCSVALQRYAAMHKDLRHFTYDLQVARYRCGRLYLSNISPNTTPRRLCYFTRTVRLGAVTMPRICLTVSRSVVSVSDSYARVWNLGFASNVVQNLPQELKDMIYRELMHRGPPDFDREERDRQDKAPLGWAYSGSSPEHNELRSCTDYPRYFQSNYMGPDFVTELFKQFHKDKHFSLQHPGELEGFLSRDRFRTTCVPDELVRFISIDLSLTLFNVRTGNCRDWSSPKFDIPLRQHFVAALGGLELLNTLVKKNKSGTQRSLVLRVDCATPNHGAKFAEVLGPLVYDLKEQGWHIKTEGRFDKLSMPTSHVRHADRDAQLTASDFNYSLSRAEWTQKTRNNSAFVSRDELRFQFVQH